MHHVKQGEEVLPGRWVLLPKYKEGLMPAPLASSRPGPAHDFALILLIPKHAHPAITSRHTT